MESLQRLWEIGRIGLERQPTLTLALGGALAAVFFGALLRREDNGGGSLGNTIYRQLCRLLWATTLVALVAGAMVGFQSYLRRTLADYRHEHGRLTDVNLQAVRTIWGDEQVQGELKVALWWEEEQTERIESEDLSKPTVTRKKLIRQNVATNPFLTTRHAVTLRPNARKKGSGMYAGYETENHFRWLLHNPADREVRSTLRFPMPSTSAVFDDLTVTLNQTNVLDRLRIENGAMVIEQPLARNETVELEIKFKSRGLAYWYFQVREPREMRDFELRLHVPDLPQAKLNYPEGCMTPTAIEPDASALGCTLVYRLDRAICNKGMGIEMPKITQPGETTSAVLAEAERGWILVFAAMVIGLTLAGTPHAVLLSVLMGGAGALAYGLMGDISDTFLGFWGSAGLVLLPVLLGLGSVTMKYAGKLIGILLVIFGLLYPCLAGLDEVRQTLYLNVCAGLLLAAVAQLLKERLAGFSTTRT